MAPKINPPKTDKKKKRKNRSEVTDPFVAFPSTMNFLNHNGEEENGGKIMGEGEGSVFMERHLQVQSGRSGGAGRRIWGSLPPVWVP